MADDGMLLNFDIGTGPFKPTIQISGGRWRDRAQARRDAREPRLGDGFPDSKPAQRKTEDHTDAIADERPAKRLKSADGLPTQRFGINQDLPPRQTSSRHDHEPKPRANSTVLALQAQGRQVTSRLFTANPEQRTVFEEPAEEWTAPAPSNAPLPDTDSFASLGLSPRLVEELAKTNVSRPTAIQKAVVPLMVSSDTDAFVQAETGSGKTYSYLLPIVHRVLQVTESAGAQLHRNSGVFAMIISPTRELAKQTHAVLEHILRPFPWLVASAITGGESKKAEKSRFRKGVNFIVATPGRLADHIDNTKVLSFRTVRWLVLDEGDRLMELGFEDELKKVVACLKKVDVADRASDGVSLACLPSRRVTVLCSATMQVNVKKLGEISLADAAFIQASKDIGDDTDAHGGNAVHKAPDQLHQSYTIVPAKLRLVTLISFLKSVFSRRCSDTTKVIVFITCADSVDFHFDLLKLGALEDEPTSTALETVAKAAYVASPATPEVALYKLHGSLSQPVRTSTLRTFTSLKKPAVLLTTDIASRGLDIPSVDMVIEYDPAFCFADHIHRVGRTARAGRPGDALLFLLPGCEEGYLQLLNASAAATAMPYEKILQNGLTRLDEFPFETHAKASDARSCTQKAETLQLHLEQRILPNARMLDVARNGFKSHIRAYATHVKEERGHFNITELHLGHMAKAYGLREAPGGIGSGIDRKAIKRRMAKSAEAKESDMKASRAALFKKSRALMTGAYEFNLG